MTTRDDLVDEVVSNLEGFTVAPGQSTHLTADVSASDLSLPVADASQVSAGILEVGDELVWCTSSDASSSQAAVPPYGRGYRGSTAAAHLSGTQVRMAPAWPRHVVAREINNAIDGVYPLLFAVREAPAIQVDGVTYQFDLPSDAERVVDVRYMFTSVTGWQRARAWELEHKAPSSFAGGRFLSIYGGPPPGSTVQVVYLARPARLVNGSDDFAAVSGLSDQCKDVIVLAAMARMARFMDLARLPNRDDVNDNRTVGAATDVANDLFRQYQTRLLEEQSALSARFPVRPHKVR